MPLLFPIRATCPVHLIRLHFITRIILGEEYRSLSSSLYSFLQSPLTLSLLGSSILLNTLFSSTLSLRYFLNVSNQVSHPYKTTGKIIALYTLTFTFFISHWKTKDSARNDSKHSVTECNTEFRNVGIAQSVHSSRWTRMFDSLTDRM